MYLCTVTIILVAVINMEIKYINGFISEACFRGLKDFEQVRDAIIVAKCEGFPFRGRPKDMARDFIVSNEFAPRCYYSGFLGSLNPDAETHLYVSLRCMRIDKDTCSLYAGGGLLADSDMETEWRETEMKMDTMRNLLA